VNYKDFDAAISDSKVQSIDRALAILWLGKVAQGVEGMTAKEIARIMEQDCGHPAQNASRLFERLRADRRTAKHGADGFRLRPDALKVLSAKYEGLLALPSVPKVSGSAGMIPCELFLPAKRSYLVRLVDQVNGCYQNGYFDGVMVLGRKLLETLVIEVYVQDGRAAEIKRTDGAFLTFEELSGKIAADSKVHVTRETKKTLASMKKFGDQSAHNQRFTAQLSDVDELKQGLRIAAEELLHHCNYQS